VYRNIISFVISAEQRQSYRCLADHWRR